MRTAERLRPAMGCSVRHRYGLRTGVHVLHGSDGVQLGRTRTPASLRMSPSRPSRAARYPCCRPFSRRPIRAFRPSLPSARRAPRAPRPRRTRARPSKRARAPSIPTAHRRGRAGAKRVAATWLCPPEDPLSTRGARWLASRPTRTSFSRSAVEAPRPRRSGPAARRQHHHRLEHPTAESKPRGRRDRPPQPVRRAGAEAVRLARTAQAQPGPSSPQGFSRPLDGGPEGGVECPDRRCRGSWPCTRSSARGMN